MALAKRPISIPFGQGIDTKTDPKQVALGKLLVCENAIFNTGKSLRKRNGFKLSDPIPASVLDVGAAQALLSREDERLVVAGHQLHAYSPAGKSWTPRGQLRSLGQSTAPLYADAFEQTSPDMAIANGVSLAATQTTEGANGRAIRVVLTDEATGTRLFSRLATDDGYNPKCVAVGQYLYCFFRFAASISWIRFNSMDPRSSVSISNSLFSPAQLPYTPTDIWDVAVYNEAVLVLAYQDAEDGCVNVMYLTPDPATGTLLVGAPTNGYPPPFRDTTSAAAAAALALATGPGCIGYVIAFDIAVASMIGAALDSDLVATASGKVGLAPAVGITHVGAVYSDLLGCFYVVYESRSASGLPYNMQTRNCRLFLTGGSTGHDQLLFRSLGMASTPFVHDGQVHVWLVYDGGPLSPQNTVFLCTVAVAGTVLEAKALAGRAAGLATAPSLPRPCQGTPGVWTTAMGARNLFKVGLNSAAAFTKNAQRVDLDFSREAFVPAELQQSLHVGGAQVHQYDGLGVVEDGFPIVPEISVADTGVFKLEVVDSKVGTNQIVKITPPADDLGAFPPRHSGAQVTPGSYLIIWDDDVGGDPAATVLWFRVDGVGSNPVPVINAGQTSVIRIEISAQDSQQDVARAISEFTNHYGYTFGPAPDPSALYNDGDGFCIITAYLPQSAGQGMCFPLDHTQMGYDVVIPGVTGTPGTGEITRLTFPAGKWISSGQWFQLESDTNNDPGSGAGTAPNDIGCFYFVVDGTPPAVVPSPATSSITPAIPIAISSTDTPADVADAVRAVIITVPNGTGFVTPFLWTATANGPSIDVRSVANTAVPPSHALITLTASGATAFRNKNVGGEIRAGQTALFALYEWTDLQGRYHRSGPSSPILLTIGAKDGATDSSAATSPTGQDGLNLHVTKSSIVWGVSTLRCSRKTNVRIGLFRPSVNGQFAKRVATLVNDPTVDSVAFTDGVADPALDSAETLYTQAGEVANEAPPASQASCVYQGRVMLGGIDSDPLAIWPSKALGQGYGVAWSSLLSLRVSEDGGAVTALAVMDTYLVIFKAGRICLLSGEGPSNAAQGGFGVPVELTTEEGTTNPASVVLVEKGLLFQGSKGICLLTRSLGVEYIGAEVEKFGRLAITSAAVLAREHQVRWTTLEGPSIVYDMAYGQWGTNSYKARSAKVWGGTYTLLRPDSAVLVETPGIFADAGVPVRLRVATAWLKFDDLAQGMGRIYKAFVLGEYKGQHRLRVRAAFDYSDATEVDLVWDAFSALGGHVYGSATPYGAGTPYGDTTVARQYQVRIMLPRQKCEALKLTIEDLDSGSGEAVSLADLQLEVGVMAGSWKMGGGNATG